MIIVQILSTLSPIYKMLPESTVQQFLQEVEQAYSQFGVSASHFLTMHIEDPEKQPVVLFFSSHDKMPTPSVTQQITSSFTPSGSSSQGSDPSLQLPHIITGSGESSLQSITQSRGRSLSIDLLNQPSSALLRDRMNTITVGLDPGSLHRTNPLLLCPTPFWSSTRCYGSSYACYACTHSWSRSTSPHCSVVVTCLLHL